MSAIDISGSQKSDKGVHEIINDIKAELFKGEACKMKAFRL